jgi:Ca2+-binding EF-hand superfamily protein
MVTLEAFRRLDPSNSGSVPVEELLQIYDASTHPSVVEGRITSEQATQFMLNTFREGNELNGKVAWPEFLDYYKGISLAVPDDDTFELLVRNAWSSRGGQFVTATYQWSAKV